MLYPSSISLNSVDAAKTRWIDWGGGIRLPTIDFILTCSTLSRFHDDSKDEVRRPAKSTYVDKIETFKVFSSANTTTEKLQEVLVYLEQEGVLDQLENPNVFYQIAKKYVDQDVSPIKGVDRVDFLSVLSGLDIAAWDLYSKIKGVSLNKCLSQQLGLEAAAVSQHVTAYASTQLNMPTITDVQSGKLRRAKSDEITESMLLKFVAPLQKELDNGFKVIKIYINGFGHRDPAHMNQGEWRALEEKLIKATRNKVGDEITLMLDFFGSDPYLFENHTVSRIMAEKPSTLFNHEGNYHSSNYLEAYGQGSTADPKNIRDSHWFKLTKDITDLLESQNFAMFEEPASPYQPNIYIELRKYIEEQGYQLKVSGAEFSMSASEFSEFFKHGKALDIAQPDPGWALGISGILDLHKALKEHNANIMLHCWSSAIHVIIAVHFSALSQRSGFPNIVELMTTPELLAQLEVTSDGDPTLKLNEHGQLSVPTEPGIGVHFSKSVVEKMTSIWTSEKSHCSV